MRDETHKKLASSDAKTQQAGYRADHKRYMKQLVEKSNAQTQMIMSDAAKEAENGQMTLHDAVLSSYETIKTNE